MHPMYYKPDVVIIILSLGVTDVLLLGVMIIKLTSDRYVVILIFILTPDKYNYVTVSVKTLHFHTKTDINF